jgi:hypothetical protein
MLQNLKQIEKLLNLDLSLDQFYVIRIYSDIIHLQGEHNPLVQSQCEELGFEFNPERNYLVAKQNGFEITLCLSHESL